MPWTLVGGRYEEVSEPVPFENCGGLPLFLVATRLPPGGRYVVYAENCRATRPETSDEEARDGYEWHSKRARAAIARHGTRITALFDARKLAQRLILWGAIVVQLGVAVRVGGVLHVLALAAVGGSYLQFAMQAMMHEIFHRGVSPFDAVAFLIADCTFGLSGPGFFFYYREYHGLHHRRMGEEDDPDAALHSLWARRPSGLLRRVAWTWWVGGATKAALLANDLRGACDMHLRAIGALRCTLFLAFVVGAHAALVVATGGATASAYLSLSSAFALGAGPHPLLLLWIMQHCASPLTEMQSTVSLRAGSLWHLPTFGTLYHTEHHDFPLVPFYRLRRLSEVLQSDDDSARVHRVEAPSRFILAWLLSAGPAWMDVGAQATRARRRFAHRL